MIRKLIYLSSDSLQFCLVAVFLWWDIKDAISCRDYLMENELPAASKFLIDKPPWRKSCLKDLMLTWAVFELRNNISLRK